MIDLFAAPTGASYDKPGSAAVGTPGYEENIVSGAAKRLKPAYQQAMMGLDQNNASRGLLNSGIAAQSHGDLAENYLGQLSGIADQAETHSADIAEENRRAEQQRGWQVQDRDVQMKWLKDQADRQEQIAQANQWADLVGGAAGAVGGAVGTYYGGPAGGAALGAAGKGLGDSMKKPTSSAYQTAYDKLQNQQRNPSLVGQQSDNFAASVGY